MADLRLQCPLVTHCGHEAEGILRERLHRRYPVCSDRSVTTHQSPKQIVMAATKPKAVIMSDRVSRMVSFGG